MLFLIWVLLISFSIRTLIMANLASVSDFMNANYINPYWLIPESCLCAEAGRYVTLFPGHSVIIFYVISMLKRFSSLFIFKQSPLQKKNLWNIKTDNFAKNGIENQLIKKSYIVGRRVFVQKTQRKFL
jgi:hypothetical protein